MNMPIGKSELSNWEVKTTGLPVENRTFEQLFLRFFGFGKSKLSILGSQNYLFRRLLGSQDYVLFCAFVIIS
jgi:hypothetical protein